jgi:gas vesicle protein
MPEEQPNEGLKVIELYDRRKAQAGLMMPFLDGMPYEEGRILNEVKILTGMECAVKFEIGKRLILVKENNDVGTFQQRIEDLGMDRITAWEYMIYAQMAEGAPAFLAWAESKNHWRKAITMIRAARERAVEEFEQEGSFLGVPKDKLDQMSVRELKDLIKKQKKEHAREIEKAGKDTAQENQRLKKRLEALESADEDVNKGRKLLEAGDKLLTDGLATLAKADFMLLRRDAAAVAIGRELIFKVRRIADHLEAEMFG